MRRQAASTRSTGIRRAQCDVGFASDDGGGVDWVGVRGEERGASADVVSLRAQTAVGLRRRFRRYKACDLVALDLLAGWVCGRMYSSFSWLTVCDRQGSG
jgi:hypothetical protein